jgi:acyl-CoA thioester hydrolase
MGHVNHAVFLTYMEEARIAYLRTVFGSLDKALEAGVGVPGRDREPFEFVVAHADIDYRSPARLGDALAVACRASRLGKTSFDISYAVSQVGGSEVAQGKTTQVFIDGSGRPRPLPPPFRSGIEAFEGDLGRA